MKNKYIVTIEIIGKFIVKVSASDFDEACQKAENIAHKTNFYLLSDVRWDTEDIEVQSQRNNYIVTIHMIGKFDIKIMANTIDNTVKKAEHIAAKTDFHPLSDIGWIPDDIEVQLKL